MFLFGIDALVWKFGCVNFLQATEIARSTEPEETGVRTVDCRSVLPWEWTATV